MRNILAIAQRELKAYFASPIAYVVMGIFALVFGAFFYSILQFFVRQSLQGAQFGPSSINVNQMMIRPVILNTSIVVLFTVPLLTMRTFAEEKRSGTIELLLTSPITDWELVLGKFLGAVSLFGITLLVTLVDVAVLFYFGNPEWKQIATSYLGLLLMASCFIAVGLFLTAKSIDAERWNG